MVARSYRTFDTRHDGNRQYEGEDYNDMKRQKIDNEGCHS